MSKEIDLLKDCLKQRQDEVFEYEFNLKNYKLAIESARKDPDLDQFCVQLENLIQTTTKELKKSMIMLKVMETRLERSG